MSETSGQAAIKDGVITISVPVEQLSDIIEGAWQSGFTDTRFKVTDPEAFAVDLVRALNDEDEDGTTAVHRMFDQAVNYAFEQGAEGIEEHEDQEF